MLALAPLVLALSLLGAADGSLGHTAAGVAAVAPSGAQENGNVSPNEP